MRVANQITNEIARKSGLQIFQSPLAVENGNTGDSLLDALSKNNKTSGLNNKTQSANYGKLEKAAEQLEQSAQAVIEKTDKADKPDMVYQNVKELVERYNKSMEALHSTSDPLNEYYRQMLEANYLDNKDALSSIGITAGKDGTLKLDENKLKSADMETIKKVLGSDGVFTARVGFTASRIADNAGANLRSFSSQYNAAGSIYGAMGNKFNIWG